MLHANCLLKGKFAWNVRSYFLGKTRLNMSLTSADFAHCMVSVYHLFLFVIHVCILLFLLSCILYVCILYTILSTNVADDKLMLFSLIFPENRHSDFMQIVSWGDDLHEMSKLFSGKIRKVFQNLLKFLASVLCVHSCCCCVKFICFNHALFLFVINISIHFEIFVCLNYVYWLISQFSL